MTYPWAMDNNGVKYPDQTWQWGIMALILSICALWPWAKVMTHPWVMDNNGVKYHSDPTWQWGVMAQTPNLGTCAPLPCPWRYPDLTWLWEVMAWTSILAVCTMTLTIWPWVKVMTHPWVMDNNCVKYYPDPTWQWEVMARTGILGVCALGPWRYNLGSRSWHTLGSWTATVWNTIQIEQGGNTCNLWSEHNVNRRTGWILYTPKP